MVKCNLMQMCRLCLLLLISLLIWPHSAQASIFGTKEVRSENLRPFFKWNGMWDRFRGEAQEPENCNPAKSRSCARQKWTGFLDSLDGKDLTTKIQEVNSYMNAHPYILDIINWGIQDYWATPFQFFLKDGDCEDYAIAKYESLKKLGVSPNDMRIVVLQDMNLNIIHAVLMVKAGKDILILDNQIQQVISDSKIYHYKPIYSINETAWWRHL